MNTKSFKILMVAIIAGSLGAAMFYYLSPALALDCEGGCDPGYGLVHGYKWYDYDGDGVWDAEDPEEPPRGGWGIYLVSEGVAYQTETDSSGYYAFEEVAEGDYKICERSYDGWSETYPKEDTEDVAACDGESQAPRGYAVSVVGGGEYGDFNFGNTYALGSIRAFKFSDLNSNGEWDEENEPLLPGWEICIENDDIDDPFLNNLWDFFFDDFDECKTTDGSGNVLWTGLPPGWYETWENMPEEQGDEEWAQTAMPEDENEGEGWIRLDAGENNVSAFGNHLRITVITGRKWGDLNHDGEWSRDEEPVLAGWTMALGKVGDPFVPREGGPETIPIEIVALSLTSANGTYVLPVKEPGAYKVFEESRGGWHATYPEHQQVDSFFDITYHIDLAAEPLLNRDSFFDVFVDELRNQEITTDVRENLLDFGNFEEPVITGYKWNDLDEDSEWNRDEENSELGVRGWTVALGKMSEPRPDHGGPETIPIEIVALSLTGGDGSYTLRVPSPGRYMVMEESRDGWRPTYPAPQRIDSFFDIFTELDIDAPLPPFVPDSFFDVFVEIAGQQEGLNQSFDFGNHEIPAEEPPVLPPPPPALDLPECSDGADNDGDGLIDRQDPACTSDLIDDENNSNGGGGGDGGGGGGGSPSIGAGGGGLSAPSILPPQEQVLGVSVENLSVEEQIAGLREEIERLKSLLLEAIEKLIAELQAELDALLAE